MFRTIAAAVVLGSMAILPLSASAEMEVEVSGGGERVSIKRISATIIDIDHETRDVTLQGPLGNAVTLQASADVTRLNEFEKGDFVVVAFRESLSGELREPTEEELAVPWVELDVAAIADSDLPPGAAAGQAIRALCTIEGMNRITQTVTVLDPKGNFHVIGDVDPDKMANVTLGQTIVLTYTRGVALSLEKHAGAAQ